jgi:Tol biopolymer transport system component
MADLDERLHSLSRTRSPDLWPDIETREPRFQIPESSRSHRALAAAVALVIAVVGIGFAAVTFTGSDPGAATGTSGVSTPAVSNGWIAFTSGEGGYHISMVRSDGRARDLSVPVNDDYDLAPGWSPDGRRLAFLRYTRGDYDLVVANADGTGLVEFGRAEDFSWAPDGSAIVYTRFRQGSDLDIVIGEVDGGEPTELITGPLTDADPSWSPSGEWIAFVSHPVLDRDPGSADIFVVRPDGTGLTRLTDGPAWDWDPQWSPDGSRIAFVSDHDGGSEIFVMNADGSAPTRITDVRGDVSEFTWSPDGRELAFGVHSGTSWDIYVVSVDGSGQMAIAEGPQDETGAEWSPDGTLLAYTAAESAESCQCDNSGTFEIYLMEPDGTGKVRLTDGARELGGGLSWQAV